MLQADLGGEAEGKRKAEKMRFKRIRWPVELYMQLESPYHV
jgi:hypothetical protein